MLKLTRLPFFAVQFCCFIFIFFSIFFYWENFAPQSKLWTMNRLHRRRPPMQQRYEILFPNVIRFKSVCLFVLMSVVQHVLATILVECWPFSFYIWFYAFLVLFLHWGPEEVSSVSVLLLFECCFYGQIFCFSVSLIFLFLRFLFIFSFYLS